MADPVPRGSSSMILAISGSLRRASINSAVLRAAALGAARDGIRVEIADFVRDLYRKPVAVLKVSPPGRGDHARDTLDLALRAHGAEVVHRSVPVSHRDLDAGGELGDTRILAELRAVLVELDSRARARDASST